MNKDFSSDLSSYIRGHVAKSIALSNSDIVIIDVEMINSLIQGESLSYIYNYVMLKVICQQLLTDWYIYILIDAPAIIPINTKQIITIPLMHHLRIRHQNTVAIQNAIAALRYFSGLMLYLFVSSIQAFSCLSR